MGSRERLEREGVDKGDPGVEEGVGSGDGVADMVASEVTRKDRGLAVVASDARWGWAVAAEEGARVGLLLDDVVIVGSCTRSFRLASSDDDEMVSVRVGDEDVVVGVAVGREGDKSWKRDGEGAERVEERSVMDPSGDKLKAYYLILSLPLVPGALPLRSPSEADLSCHCARNETPRSCLQSSKRGQYRASTAVKPI